jgi:hypothetical protein
VKERPILFSEQMVKMMLDGRKLQTRRIFKPSPPAWVQEFGFSMLTPPGQIEGRGIHPEVGPGSSFFPCRYGLPGDRLWVRETWQMNDVRFVRGPIPKTRPADLAELAYRADGEAHEQWPEEIDRDGWHWRPGIHMPRWASRITLEIVQVRVERLQEIDDHDALAEGVTPLGDTDGAAVAGFRKLWDSINGKRAPWKKNPWLWCVSFKVVGR